jgi:hypothetical protein
MKGISFFIMLLFPLLGIAQSDNYQQTSVIYYDNYNKDADPTAIQKGDNLIKILTDKSDYENFFNFATLLKNRGYTFEKFSEDSLDIITAPKFTHYGLHYQYQLRINFQDTLILVRASQYIPESDPITREVTVQQKEWKYLNHPGTAMRQTFEDFYPVIKSYNYLITYSKE